MKKSLTILFGVILSLTLFGCTSSQDLQEDTAEEEESEQLTYEVSDPDYYTKFKDKGISINVYNWGEYISDGSDGCVDINSEFTALTGITVNYSTYATNEELYAKLKGGASSYDIIIPSDYMISRMIKENMLKKLNLKNIPNLSNTDETFLNPSYDEKNEYSVPYTFGTVGIIYDKTMIDEENIDWDILWDEDYANEILMFDNPRDAFAIAELKLGYSINTENEDEIRAAAELLKKQKKYVQAYVMDEIFDKMGAGEALLAPYYAGDAVTLMDEYEDLGFVIPESGTNLFIDAMCIPTGSKQQEAAEMYINFMCEPDIAYSTTEYIGYSTPNKEAFEMLDDEVKQDGISYLDEDYLNEKTAIYVNLSDNANQLMQNLWTEMKSSDDDVKNPWIVPLFMLVCILISVGILIGRHVKKKKDMF